MPTLQGTTSAQCTDNGKFDKVIGVCIDIHKSCEIPAHVSNGKFVDEANVHVTGRINSGSYVTLRCNTGYQVTSSVITLNCYHGQLSSVSGGELAACILPVCAIPTVPNGIVIREEAGAVAVSSRSI